MLNKTAQYLFIFVLGIIFIFPKTASAYTFSVPTFDINAWISSFTKSYPQVIISPVPSLPVPSFPTMPRTTSTPTVKPSPTQSPRPTPSPTPKPTLTPSPRPSSTSSPALTSVKSYIMNAINSYRAQNGLSGVQTDSYTCNFAKTRAQEITTSFNHDGFQNRINSKTLPYPGYSYVTENIAMTSNYQQVVQMWINSPGHAANMRADTPYVCVEQNGNYYAYEGWKP